MTKEKSTPDELLNKSLSRSLKNQLGSDAAAITAIKDKAVMLGLNPDECTTGEVLTMSMVVSAIHGKTMLTQEIFDRIEGKAPDIVRNDQTGEIRASLEDLSEEQLERIVKNK